MALIRRAVPRASQPSGIPLPSSLFQGGFVWSGAAPSVIAAAGAHYLGASENTLTGSGPGGAHAYWTNTASSTSGVNVPRVLLPVTNAVTLVVYGQPASEAVTRSVFSLKAPGFFVPQLSISFNAANNLGVEAGSLLVYGRDASANLTNIRATGQSDGGLHCWVIRATTAGAAIWRDGILQSLATAGALSGNVLYDTGAVTTVGNRYASDFTTRFSNPLYLVAGVPRALSDAECRAISAEPWCVFAPLQRVLPPFTASVTLCRPSGDILTTGWAASSGSDLFAMVDEPVANDSDYVVSPAAQCPDPAHARHRAIGALWYAHRPHPRKAHRRDRAGARAPAGCEQCDPGLERVAIAHIN